jgi:thiamine transporter
LEPDPDNTGGGMKIMENISRTRVLAEIAIMVALAYVLNLIKIFHLPQGGSVTLGSMVPILLIAYRHGWKEGVFSGVLFGLVQLALEGYIFHPIQVILDYPLAFGILGTAALFEDRPILGVIVGLTGRFLAHFISGVVYFGTYAPEGWSPIVYSAVYNGGYLIPEMIISGILLYFLIKRDIFKLQL